jgi:hypothetical protein
MRNLTATLCLTLAVLLGSAGMSVSQDYQKGLDAAQRGDFAIALREWTPLAEQGGAKAQFNLGLMYRKGDGVQQDHEESAKWFRRAAEQGHDNAQLNLGVSFERGEGVPQDYAEAVKWYKLAAEQGPSLVSRLAQANLGYIYQIGNGVPQDYREAVRWFRLAAEQGEADAQYNLALRYGQGQGVPLNFELALMWSNIAASQGHMKATELGNLIASTGLETNILTPERIIEVQRLARECVAKNYKGC